MLQQEGCSGLVNTLPFAIQIAGHWKRKPATGSPVSYNVLFFCIKWSPLWYLEIFLSLWCISL